MRLFKTPWSEVIQESQLVAPTSKLERGMSFLAWPAVGSQLSQQNSKSDPNYGKLAPASTPATTTLTNDTTDTMETRFKVSRQPPILPNQEHRRLYKTIELIHVWLVTAEDIIVSLGAEHVLKETFGGRICDLAGIKQASQQHRPATSTQTSTSPVKLPCPSPSCPKVYNSIDALPRHIREKEDHGHQFYQRLIDQRFCGQCERWFGTSRHLVTHERRDHAESSTSRIDIFRSLHRKFLDEGRYPQFPGESEQPFSKKRKYGDDKIYSAPEGHQTPTLVAANHPKQKSRSGATSTSNTSIDKPPKTRHTYTRPPRRPNTIGLSLPAAPNVLLESSLAPPTHSDATQHPPPLHRYPINPIEPARAWSIHEYAQQPPYDYYSQADHQPAQQHPYDFCLHADTPELLNDYPQADPQSAQQPPYDYYSQTELQLAQQGEYDFSLHDQLAQQFINGIL